MGGYPRPTPGWMSRGALAASAGAGHVTSAGSCNSSRQYLVGTRHSDRHLRHEKKTKCRLAAGRGGGGQAGRTGQRRATRRADQGSGGGGVAEGVAPLIPKEVASVPPPAAKITPRTWGVSTGHPRNARNATHNCVQFHRRNRQGSLHGVVAYCGHYYWQCVKAGITSTTPFQSGVGAGGGGKAVPLLPCHALGSPQPLPGLRMGAGAGLRADKPGAWWTDGSNGNQKNVTVAA